MTAKSKRKSGNQAKEPTRSQESAERQQSPAPPRYAQSDVAPALKGLKKGLIEEPFIEAAVESTGAKQPTVEALQGEPEPQLVHFEFNMPGARKVCLAGSFNEWRPHATELIPLGGGKWVKDLVLQPGTYEYRLVVDGEWMPDPNASRTVPNPFGEPNSLLIVPL